MPEIDALTNQLLHGLCDHLDVHPHNVREIRLGPRTITVESFELNDEGKKFIGADGTIAVASRTIPFTYQERVA